MIIGEFKVFSLKKLRSSFIFQGIPPCLPITLSFDTAAISMISIRRQWELVCEGVSDSLLVQSRLWKN